MSTADANARSKGQALRLITGRTPRSRATKSDRSFSRFASFLWLSRSEAGLSLKALAVELGVSLGRLYHWEKGERLSSLVDLDRLCDVLNVDPTGFLILRLGALLDREFHRGAPSVEALHQRLIAALESQAEVKLRRP